MVIDVSASYNVGLFFLAGLHIISTLVWGLLPVADAYCQSRPNDTRQLNHQRPSLKQYKLQKLQKQQYQQQQQQKQHITQPMRENVSLFHPAAPRPVGYASMVH